jgi:hypothetical protein
VGFLRGGWWRGLRDDGTRVIFDDRLNARRVGSTTAVVST